MSSLQINIKRSLRIKFNGNYKMKITFCMFTYVKELLCMLNLFTSNKFITFTYQICVCNVGVAIRKRCVHG